MTFSKRLK